MLQLQEGAEKLYPTPITLNTLFSNKQLHVKDGKFNFDANDGGIIT